MNLRICIALAWVMFAWASTTLSAADEPPAWPDADRSGALKVGASYAVIAEVVSETRDGQTRPMLRAGSFIIPEGASGVNLQYRFEDPGLGFTSTKLRMSNLYSVTERRYLHELETKPIVALPPGEYRLEIGGSSGAGGELTVTVVPGVPGTASPPPGAKPDAVGTSPPTTTVPPATPDDDETQAVSEAVAGAWSGSYTVEKITGDASGFGTVQGRRALGLTIQPGDHGLIDTTGTVWVPPGTFGRAGSGSLERKSIWFYVTGKPTARGVLFIHFRGTVDPAAGSMQGTLKGYLPKGDSSEEIFQGTWQMKRKS